MGRICFLLIFSFSTTSATSNAAEFFVLQGIDKSLSDSVLKQAGVDGFTIRVSWRRLHEEGFGWLDEQIARGSRLNLDLQLRVLAGSSAPGNLPGVSYFDYLSSDADGGSQLRRVPVPWDAAMRQQWSLTTAELGRRYGNNERIKVVHVPSFADSSELHTPDEVVQLAGYSSRALAESWAAMAAPLATAFPNSIITLNYATPTQAKIAGEDSGWLLEELARLAGKRAGYQSNDLSAKVTLDRNKYQTLVGQRELGRNLGFQMLSSSSALRFGGEFSTALSTGLAAGAQWFEIYAADISNIPPRGDFNLDGMVDGRDYVLWRRANANDLSSDYYDRWRQHFGYLAASAATAGGASLSVLEPGTAALLSFGAAWLSMRRRPSRTEGATPTDSPGSR